MKRLKKIFSQMTLLAVMLTATVAATLPASAKVHYRGFVEGGIGVTTVTGESNVEDNGGGAALGYMLATTHGIQIGKNFFGLGIGIAPSYCALNNNSYDHTRLSRLSFPVYANWRYDFFKESVWNPYISAKCGLFLPIAGDQEYDNRNYSGASYWYDSFEGIFPVYAALDFGMRKRISSNSGISFGLTIQTAANGEIDYYSDYGQLGISILAKVAFDF